MRNETTWAGESASRPRPGWGSLRDGRPLAGVLLRFPCRALGRLMRRVFVGLEAPARGGAASGRSRRGWRGRRRLRVRPHATEEGAAGRAHGDRGGNHAGEDVERIAAAHHQRNVAQEPQTGVTRRA